MPKSDITTYRGRPPPLQILAVEGPIGINTGTDIKKHVQNMLQICFCKKELYLKERIENSLQL